MPIDWLYYVLGSVGKPVTVDYWTAVSLSSQRQVGPANYFIFCFVFLLFGFHTSFFSTEETFRLSIENSFMTIQESKEEEMEAQHRSMEVRAMEALGKGFDLTSDFRLKFTKERLVELDHQNKRDVIVPGGLTIPDVSQDIRFDKGDRIRFKSDVLEFNQVFLSPSLSVSLSIVNFLWRLINWAQFLKLIIYFTFDDNDYLFGLVKI